MTFFGGLPEFIRLKLSITAALLASCGYMLFSPSGPGLVFISSGSFFGCCAIYGYNNMIDKKEDMVNRGKVNPIARSPIGRPLVAVCLTAGFAFASFLPPVSLILYSLFVAGCMLYSAFGVKRYFLVKNIYTAFALSLVFMSGAAYSAFHVDMVAYAAVVFLLMLSGSFASDLRDMKGDAHAGFRTIPVVMGRATAKASVLSILAFMMLSVVFLDLSRLLVIIPFALLKFFLIAGERFNLAHNVNGLSVIALAASLLVA